MFIYRYFNPLPGPSLEQTLTTLAGEYDPNISDKELTPEMSKVLDVLLKTPNEVPRALRHVINQLRPDQRHNLTKIVRDVLIPHVQVIPSDTTVPIPQYDQESCMEALNNSLVLMAGPSPTWLTNLLPSHIMPYLSPKERANVAAVCKSWAVAAESAKESTDSLDLSHMGNTLTDAKLLKILEQYPNVKKINLSGCNVITHASMKRLATCHNLESVNLHWCTQISNRDLEALTQLPNLKSLDLSGCDGLDVHGLQHLGKFVNLEALNLSDMKWIGDGELLTLAQLPNLKSLNLSECYRITSTGVRHLYALVNLESLALPHCRGLLITDGDLQRLSALPNLQILELGNCSQVTDLGLQHLSTLANLQTLQLAGCALVTDEGLQHLVALAQLKSLDLYGFPQISDSGLQHLVALAQLKSLALYGFPQITDGCLQDLDALTELQWLHLYHCAQISEDGVSVLKNQRPDIHVDFLAY